MGSGKGDTDRYKWNWLVDIHLEQSVAHRKTLLKKTRIPIKFNFDNLLSPLRLNGG